MSSGSSSVELQFRADDALDALRMRGVVRAFLEAEADADSDLDGALLVFGELVANVVRHAPGAIAVRIEWPDLGPVVLMVDDWGPGIRPSIPLTDPMRESGRGIEIVRALSPVVRIVTAPLGGTHVSAELPVWRKKRPAA